MDRETFFTEYAALIDEVRVLLPGADIYLHTLVPVTVTRAAAREPDNALLSDWSQAIRRLALEKRTFLVDTASPLTAASGALPRKYGENDGLHLSAAGNAALAACLRTHTAAD